MQQHDSPETEKLSYNHKMIGNDVHIIKDGGWRGRVESVVDEEYFMVSRFNDPSTVTKVSMYDIRSLSYATF
tara:strand:+ start:957 stop:1172 length:216 start_codon:yes stop_codon:yes gene_type:complete